jgi:hypothetical protein
MVRPRGDVIRRFAVTVLLALGLSTPARADGAAATAADIRCLVAVVLSVTRNPSRPIPDWAPTAMAYYTGRIQGRDPSVELHTRLAKEVYAARESDQRTEAARCGAELAALSQEETDIMVQLQSMSTGPDR